MTHRQRFFFTAADLLGPSLLAACAQISLREAMDQVQRKYVVLLDEFEKGSNFETRDAARELSSALRKPEITKESPQANDLEFHRLLQEALDTSERIQEKAAQFDSESLLKMRSEVSARCQACHEKFRGKDRS